MKAVIPVATPDWNTYYQEVPADEVPWELGGPSYELVRAVTEGYLVPPARALDVGCGLGSQSIYLAKQGFEVVGIDIAQTAITKAGKLAKFSDVSINFQIADVASLPLASDSFDIVYDRGCFQHLSVQQQFRYKSEVGRILTDGGTLLLSVFAQGFNAIALENFFTPVFGLLEEEVYSVTEKGSDQQVTWRTMLFEKQLYQLSDIN